MKRLHPYTFSLLTAFVIIVLSVIPFPEIEVAKDVPLADKWVHFVMYGFLTLVAWVETLRDERRTGTKKAASWMLLYIVLLPALLGGVLEIVQEYLTTTRSGEWLDFIADSIGVGLGTILGCGLKLISRSERSERRMSCFLNFLHRKL